MINKKNLLILILFLFPIFVNAETVDTTGPIINNYSLQTPTVNAGDNVKINIDIQDDVSGASQVLFTFINEQSENPDSIDAMLSIYCNVQNGLNNCSFNIAGSQKIGTYTLRYVWAYDERGNANCYLAEGSSSNMNSCVGYLPKTSIAINESTQNFPELISYNYKVSDSGLLSFEVEVKDPETIDFIIVDYSTIDSGLLKRVGNTSKFSGSTQITVTGAKKFSYIKIVDKKGLTSMYYYKNHPSSAGEAKNIYLFEDGIYDFKYGNDDLTRPNLNSIKLDKSSYKAPSKMKITLDAYDDLANNLQNIQIDLGILDSNGNLTDKQIGGSIYFGCKLVDHKSVCTGEITQYAEAATYIIVNIIVSDKRGNTTCYTINESYYKNDTETVNSSGFAYKHEKLDKYTFTIEPDYNSDVTTSTSSSSLIDKIIEANDYATISIDSTKNSLVKKEVFESIKGTNKIIRIETDGIVWEFNGKDIIKPKQIDTKVKIYKIDEYLGNNQSEYKELFGKGLVIKFAENDELPGIVKIRIKGDYTFRKYLGVSDLRLYFDTNSELYDVIASNIILKEDGYYEFYLNHNSTYILTNKILEDDNISDNKEGELGNDLINKENTKIEEDEEKITDDGNNSLIVVNIVFLIIIILSIIIFVNRKK